MTLNFLLVFPPPTSLFPHNEFTCSLFISSSFRPLHNNFRVSWAKSQQEKLRGSTDVATWEGQGSLTADLLILCSVVLQMPVNVPSGPHVRGSTASSWDSGTCDRPRTNLLGQHGQGLISEQQSHMPVDSHSWVQAGSDLLKRLDSFQGVRTAIYICSYHPSALASSAASAPDRTAWTHKTNLWTLQPKQVQNYIVEIAKWKKERKTNNPLELLG